MTVPEVDVSRGDAPGVDPIVCPTAGSPCAEAPTATGASTGCGFGNGTCDGDNKVFDHNTDRTATPMFREFSRQSAVPSSTVVDE